MALTIAAEIPELVSLALDAFGIPPRKIRRIKILRSVDNFVARVSVGQLNLVVRHHLCDSPGRVDFLCSILSQIQGACGLATPTLRRTPEGGSYTIYKDRALTLYDHIKGSHPASETHRLLADLCRFIRAMQELRVPVEWNGRVEAVNALEWQKLAVAFISEYADILAPYQRDAILAAVSVEEATNDLLERFPTVMVHGDLHPANLLVDNSERLCAVIDFNDARLTSSIIEYAGIARGFCLDDDARFSDASVKAIFNEIGDGPQSELRLSDFTKLTSLVCLQYVLRLYHGQWASQARELDRLRTRAMWADFQRWHYLRLSSIDLRARGL